MTLYNFIPRTVLTASQLNSNFADVSSSISGVSSLTTDHIANTSNPHNTTSAQTSFVQSGTGAVTRTAQNKMRESVSAKDFGAVGDGVADDTAALQAWINALQATVNGGGVASLSGVLPAGTYFHTGLDITRPIYIRGDGPSASVLMLAESATRPAIRLRIAYDGINYYANGNPAATVTLENLRIQAPNRTAVAGLNIAHGLDLQNAAVNPVYVNLILNDITIQGVAGDAVFAQSWTGILHAKNTYINYPGRDGVNANSCADWRWYDGEICGAIRYNILLSGCAAMHFHHVYIYVPGVNNFHCFNSDAIFVNGYMDLAGQANVYVNQSTARRLDLTGTLIRHASQTTTLTYSDIELVDSSMGDLILTNCVFESPSVNPFGPNKPLFNIQWLGATTARVLLSNTLFRAGNLYTTGVASNPEFAINLSAGLQTRGRTLEATDFGNTRLEVAADHIAARSGTAFNGFLLQANDGTATASLVGALSGCKSGVLNVCNSSGVVTARLAATDSGIVSMLPVPAYANNTAALVDLPVGCIFWNTTTVAFARTT